MHLQLKQYSDSLSYPLAFYFWKINYYIYSTGLWIIVSFWLCTTLNYKAIILLHSLYSINLHTNNIINPPSTTLTPTNHLHRLLWNQPMEREPPVAVPLPITPLDNLAISFVTAAGGSVDWYSNKDHNHRHSKWVTSGICVSLCGCVQRCLQKQHLICYDLFAPFCFAPFNFIVFLTALLPV